MEEKGRPVPVASDVARFCRAFPALYVNPGWPTRDSIIPWRLYVELSGCVPELSALDRLVTAQGVAAAIGIAMSDDGRKILRDLTSEAFPES